jgi:hypothetical protein
LAAHGVDVAATFDDGVASSRAHAEYLRGLGENAMADPEEYLAATARPVETRLGTRHGVAFEVIDLRGTGLPGTDG